MPHTDGMDYRAMIDCDPQASLTLSLGWRKPETLPVTLATLMGRVLQEQPVHAEEAILHHEEGVDLIPGSIALSGVEVSLDTRQNVLKRVLDDCRKDYSHVLLDCMPSLGMMTINALAAADSVLIPTIGRKSLLVVFTTRKRSIHYLISFKVIRWKLPLSWLRFMVCAGKKLSD